jgi:NADH:ubiquinone oxidoreductase subunit 2 (subunit N)
MITLGLIYISGEGELFGGSVINNEYTKVIKIVSLLGIIGVLGLSRGYIENKRIDRYEYVILVLFIG